MERGYPAIEVHDVSSPGIKEKAWGETGFAFSETGLGGDLE
jgi:hypothetical protein